MLSVTTTQRLRKRRVGSPAQLGLQSLLVASPLSAAVSLAVPFLFRHASTNHHGRIWPCVIRRPTRAGGHAIGDVFVTSPPPSEGGSSRVAVCGWWSPDGKAVVQPRRRIVVGGNNVVVVY